jgi:eukaryotic-like serine/threonine-protein kinase
MGTAAYMSPEQAKGRVADKRSDVWAFGAVLYEMLAGKRAFEGDDVSDILATVLKNEPDWTALPADVPSSIRTLVMRCLEKDRTRRVADIAAARFVIDEQNGLGPSATIAALPLQTPLWRRAVTATAAVVVGAAVASGAWWSVGPSTPLRTVTRFTLALAAGQQFTNPGRQVLAISPDGTRVVYVANRRLYLRPMSETEARPIVGTENDTGVGHPVFSPDGQSVAFFSGADQTLKRIAVSGGAAVTICQADNPFGMSWGPDGIVFGQGPKGIMRVSPSGGTPDLLVSLNAGESAHGPQMLPDGQAVLFTLATGGSTDRWDNAHIVVQSLKSGERKTLIDGGSDGRYLPTGHLVYALGGTLFAVPLNVRRLEVMGGPTPVVEGVRRADNATGTAQFSSSNSGSLIFAPGPAGVSRSLRVFVVADRTGTTDPLNLPPGAYAHPRVSPDGTRLAFGTDDDKEANMDLRVVWRCRSAKDHVQRKESVSCLVRRRPAGRVSIRSRGRPRHLLAARRWRRRSATAHEGGTGRVARAGIVVARRQTPSLHHRPGFDGHPVDLCAGRAEGDALWRRSVTATNRRHVLSGRPVGRVRRF